MKTRQAFRLAPSESVLRLARSVSIAALSIGLVSASAQTPIQPGQLATPQTEDQQRPDGITGRPNTASLSPLTVGQKFHYRVIQAFGLRGLAGAVVSASIGQATGTPYDWGGGMEGYGKRYASSFGANLSRQTMSFVVESLAHEDPRYYLSPDRTFKQETLSAFKQTFITKTDSGGTRFAYGRVISAFASGQLVNAWQPATNGRVIDGLERGVFSLGGDFAYNLVQEFIPLARPRIKSNSASQRP